MDREFVYVLTNPCMPDWVKVGKSKNIEQRLSDLFSTSVPLPFECFAYLEVPAEYVFSVEHGLHDLLGFSFTKEKEFFKTSPEKIYKYFETVTSFNKDFVLVKHPSLESKQEVSKTKQTNFKMLQLPVGSELQFTRGEQPVVCRVHDETNQVEYEDRVLAISALASELLGYSVNGYTVFMYEDETLWQRRLRLTNGKEKPGPTLF